MSLGPMGMNTGFDINSMVSKIVNSERVSNSNELTTSALVLIPVLVPGRPAQRVAGYDENLMANFRQKPWRSQFVLWDTSDGDPSSRPQPLMPPLVNTQ